MRAAFLPWSYTAAAGALTGAATGAVAAAVAPASASLSPPAWLVAAGAAGVCLAMVAAAGRAIAPGLASPRTLALAALLALVTAARYVAWERAPDPSAAWHGQETTWVGYHDGSYFRASAPLVVKLALASSESLPRGRLTLTGTVEPAPGRRNPGGFDYAAFLRRRGVSGQLFVANVVAARGSGPVRERLRAGVEAGLRPATAALMAAMTLGLREDLGELSDSFTAAGLAHLLALSGLHVSVLLLAAGRLLRAFGSWRPYLLMVLTGGFVALVGPTPSVVRAAAMAAAVLVALAAGTGRPRPWPVYALALAGGLVAAPQMLLDASFQLSFLAVAGLLAFLPPWTRALRLRPGDRPGRLRLLVLGGMLTSVAAQLPSISLVAGSFGALPLLSPLVNVIAVPVAAVAVPLGFAAGLLGVVWLPLAQLVNHVTALLAEVLVWCARLGERLPSLSWGEVAWAGHACWAVASGALALWSYGLLRPKRVALVLLAAAASSAAAGPAFVPPDVWFLDVGQGDSVLIRLPQGRAVLIDGGGTPFSDYDVGERVVVRALRALGVRRLDLVVATHPDADHIEGLVSVLGKLPVGLLVTGPATDAALDAELRRVADARGVAVHEARRGERLEFGPGAYALDVLHPPAGAAAGAANERSVALALMAGGAALGVFLGDIGSVTEPSLPVPPAELLMVGHHGSRHSTSAALLRAVSPRLAVISVGRNNYGHPHPDVLGRLQEHDVAAFVTQRDGAIRFDLRTLEATTAVAPR